MSTAGDVDRLEGFHAEGGVLVIADETKGINQDAFDAVQGALSGLEDSRLLVRSVPGGAGSGPFWRICSKGGDRWRIHHIASPDSSLVSPQWVEDRAHDWGVGSPLYQARVLGDFADAGEGVLFPLSLLETAVGREVEVADAEPIVLGVDVARSIAGDFNAIAACWGGKLLDITLFRETDTMRVVEKVRREAVIGIAKRVIVDVAGPGAGVVDRLRQVRCGFEVDEVYFGGGARDSQRFKDRRAEMYWRLRQRLDKGEVSFPDDEDLIADLSALRYFFTADGKIQLESKDAVRQRLRRSPDHADAVALDSLAIWRSADLRTMAGTCDRKQVVT